VGAPLAMITRQRAKSINYGLSFLIIALYYILLISAETISLRGLLFPAVNIWIPDILFAVVGIILSWRVCVS
jgi:lipopolysaccharide export LptBFGC system permease protein LptF